MAPRMQALGVLLGCRAKRAPGSLGGDGVRALAWPAGGGARPIKKPLRRGAGEAAERNQAARRTRLRRRREKPKAAPAPRRGRGPGVGVPGSETVVTKSVPVVLILVPPASEYWIRAEIVAPLEATRVGILKEMVLLAKSRLLTRLLRSTKFVWLESKPGPIKPTLRGRVRGSSVVMPLPVILIPVIGKLAGVKVPDIAN